MAGERYVMARSSKPHSFNFVRERENRGARSGVPAPLATRMPAPMPAGETNDLTAWITCDSHVRSATATCRLVSPDQLMKPSTALNVPPRPCPGEWRPQSPPSTVRRARRPVRGALHDERLDEIGHG